MTELAVWCGLGVLLVLFAEFCKLLIKFVPNVPKIYTLLDLSVQRIKKSFLVNVIGKVVTNLGTLGTKLWTGIEA